jgi:hypothetical protein
MHKNATKCNETICKWCKNKHGASKIIDTFETYQSPSQLASTFRSGFFILLVRLNLGFILRETYRCAHHTFLLGFPTGWLAPPIKHFSGTVVGKKEDFCKGSLSLPIFYFIIVLLTFFTFIFACFFLSKI